MAGIFKSLERSDVRLTPFRAHKLISLSGSQQLDNFVYVADYNPASSYVTSNPLAVTFDQGNLNTTSAEPTTSYGKYQRIVHRSLDHLYYRDFYSNSRAAFGGGNVNYQYRFLEDKAKVVSVPQQMFGEQILPESVKVYVTTSINTVGNLSYTLIDDRYGNLYVSGGMYSVFGQRVSGSVSKQLVGNWPAEVAYKYIGNTATFDSMFNRGAWQVEARHRNLLAVQLSNTPTTPNIEDLIGASFRFTSSLNSVIELNCSNEQDQLQSFNFEGGDFAIATLVRPEAQSTSTSGSIVITKSGPSERLQIDLNGNLYTESISQHSPYTVFYSASRFVFERVGATQRVAVTSSVSATNNLYHVVAQKTGSTLQLWVNGTLAGSTSDVEEPALCSNQSNIYIGNNYLTTRGFNGIIDDVKVYKGGLTTSDINLLYHTYNVGNTYVGNVFYTNGMITLTSNQSRYMGINQVDLRATQTIYETEISCTVSPGEFGMSNNRSLQRYDSNSNQFVYRDFATGSAFRPFVTTVGLYNDRNDLVAIAKLSSPIQLPTNVDTTFIIRFDRW